ncbi:MAG: alpha/beta hydrolase [Pseudomonadota bacterium]
MKKLFKFLIAIFAFIILAVAIAILGFRANAHFMESKTALELSPENGAFIETTEGVLHVSMWGENHTKTILMTHGMAAWGGLWHDTAKILAQTGFRIIAVDQPPFGFSDRSEEDFSRSKQAKRLKALEVSLGLEDYTLLGHSYGGGVALEMALRYPGEISNLILVCPVVGLRQEAQPATSNLPWLLEQEMVAEYLVSFTVTNPLMTAFLTKSFMHRKESLTHSHVEILQRPMALKNNTAFMVKWLKQFITEDPNAISRDREKVKGLGMPVNFIWGDKDTVTPISQGEELATYLQPAKFHRMKDIGHMPQLEASVEFNKALLDILLSNPSD